MFTPAEGLSEHALFVNQDLPEDWVHLYAELWWQHDIWTTSTPKMNFMFVGALAKSHELTGMREAEGIGFYQAPQFLPS